MNTSYGCDLIVTLFRLEDWLSEESEQQEHCSPSLAWQTTTHLDSDCVRLRLKLFSAAPPREGEKCINCPDGGNRCPLQSPKCKALLSSHCGRLLVVKCDSPLSEQNNAETAAVLFSMLSCFSAIYSHI